MNRIKPVIYILVLFSCLTHCSTATITEDELSIPDSIIEQSTQALMKSNVDEIIQNISSPIEMAALTRSIGAPFSRQLLCPTKYADTYNTNFKKALGLGVYGANLGYLNIYRRTAVSISYLETIKQIADGLHIGQFINNGSLKDLTKSDKLIDSLMYMSVSSYNQMDNYLRQNQRSYLSVLIITGLWIESLYLGTQVAAEIQSNKLNERIGEQKIILAELISILEYYKGDKSFSILLESLQTLNTVYQDVEIVYSPSQKGTTQANDKENRLVFIPSDSSNVVITVQELNAIKNQVADIRNRIIRGEM